MILCKFRVSSANFLGKLKHSTLGYRTEISNGGYFTPKHNAIPIFAQRKGRQSMNNEKFTQKSIEAISAALSLANERGNNAVEPQHILLALLTDSEGLLSQILTSMNIDRGALLADATSLVDSLPRITGGTRSGIYLSPDSERLLTAADKERTSMGDDFVSVEHIALALIEVKTKAAELPATVQSAASF